MANKKEISDLRHFLEELADNLGVELIATGSQANMSFGVKSALGTSRPMRVGPSNRLADISLERGVARIFGVERDDPKAPARFLAWRASRHGASVGKGAKQDIAGEAESTAATEHITIVTDTHAFSPRPVQPQKPATSSAVLSGFAAFEKNVARIKSRLVHQAAAQPQLPAAAPRPATAQEQQAQPHQLKPVAVDYEKAAVVVLKAYLKLGDDQKKALLPPPEPLQQAQPKQTPIARALNIRRTTSPIVMIVNLFGINHDAIIKKPAVDAQVLGKIHGDLLQAAKDDGAELTIDQVRASLRVYEAANEKTRTIVQQSLTTTLKSGQIGTRIGLRAQDVRTARANILKNMAQAMTGSTAPTT